MVRSFYTLLSFITISVLTQKFKHVQLVETKLAGFVEEIIAPPGLVDILVNGEVSVLQKNSDIWFFGFALWLFTPNFTSIFSSTLQIVTVFSSHDLLFWFLLYCSYDLLFQFLLAGKWWLCQKSRDFKQKVEICSSQSTD